MNIQKINDDLVAWLSVSCIRYPADGFTLGVSGGVDSAVCLGLLAQTSLPTTALLLPTDHTSEQDLADARAVTQKFQLEAIEINIEAIYKPFLETASPLNNPLSPRQAVIRGNAQARIRMMMLYAHAQQHQRIVVGTDNACEWHMGYFTKYGDGGVDIAPLIHLNKKTVYALGRYLEIPTSIMNKAPSAGLWVGQTDEDEMGVSYAEIDAYLQGEPVSEHAKARIDFWHTRSHHKRALPLTPPKPTRYSKLDKD